MMWYGNQGRIQGGLRVQTSLRQYDEKNCDVSFSQCFYDISVQWSFNVDLFMQTFDIIDWLKIQSRWLLSGA